MRSEIETPPRNTKRGDYRAQIAACSQWPRAESGVAEPNALEVPALIFVGAHDPATPVQAAGRAAALLPHSRLVVVPHGAHSVNGLGETKGEPTAVDDTCAAQARRLPFILQ